ncbi:hypothetical protein CR983_00210 [Candidatus Saccharibacteria bacterium]|nr:MAG: hypothetical protein CR983_00210 [Candidatus Saccharibacteria bacterium]
MRRIILCKQSTSPIIAHMYEHLVMTELKKRAWQAGLFVQMDYSARGTYYTREGCIIVELELHNDEANVLEDALHQIQAPTTGASLALVTGQIAAEKETIVNCEGGIDTLQKDISELNNTAWQSIDEIREPIVAVRERKRSNLYELAGPGVDIVKPSYRLQRPALDDRSLEPIVCYLLAAIHATAASVANYRLGYYDLGGEYKHSKHYWAATNRFAVLSPHEDARLRDTYTDVIEAIREDEPIRRMARRMQSFDYSTGQSDVPDIEYFIMELGILIGENTWRERANEATISMLLQDITLIRQRSRGGQPTAQDDSD